MGKGHFDFDLPHEEETKATTPRNTSSALIRSLIAKDHPVEVVRVPTHIIASMLHAEPTGDFMRDGHDDVTRVNVSQLRTLIGMMTDGVEKVPLSQWRTAKLTAVTNVDLPKTREFGHWNADRAERENVYSTDDSMMNGNDDKNNISDSCTDDDAMKGSDSLQDENAGNDSKLSRNARKKRLRANAKKAMLNAVATLGQAANGPIARQLLAGRGDLRAPFPQLPMSFPHPPPPIYPSRYRHHDDPYAPPLLQQRYDGRDPPFAMDDRYLRGPQHWIESEGWWHQG